jgi:hypothetical protein
MERISEPQKNVIFDQNEEPIVLSKHLLEILLQDPHPVEVIGLYVFYYFQAKYQKTNQIWATTEFTANGLHWGIEKVRSVKTRLRNLGLIEDIQNREQNNIFGKWYIKINFIWTQRRTSDFPNLGFSEPRIFRTSEKSTTKCLKEKELKCLKEKELNKNTLSPKMEYFPFAEKLSKIISTKKSIHHTPTQIQSWAKEIKKLINTNKIESHRVQAALDWYSENIGMPYVPVIESGSSFREKFLKLEDAMQRQESTWGSNSPKNKPIKAGSHFSGTKVKYKKSDITIS